MRLYLTVLSLLFALLALVLSSFALRAIGAVLAGGL